MRATDLNELLQNEAYTTIISECKDQGNLSDENQLLLGIAYYKTDDYQTAETIFETLNTTNPTNEISTYLIICKIKLEKLLEALKLYETLCIEENKAIIEFITNKDYQNALNLTLFLKSIPLEIQKKPCKSDDLIDLTHANDYTRLSLALAEKAN